MTGSCWLARLMREEPDAIKRRAMMKRRIQRKARDLSPEAAADLLRSFRGISGHGSKPTQLAWLGCWSQSLDAQLRQALQRRVLAGGRR